MPKENNKLASKATFVVNPDLTADGSYKPEDFVYGYYGTNNEYWAIVGLSETGAGKLALGNKNINFPGADPEGRPVTAFAADSFRELQFNAADVSAMTELQVIGKEAFYKSTVNEFNFRALPNLRLIEESAFVNTKIERADFKDLHFLEKISNDAFRNSQVKYVRFDNNDNLTDIEKWAFESARLTDIIFGNLPSLKTLGVASFGVASNISYVGSPEVITTLNQPIDLSGAPNLEVFGGEVFRRRKMDSINLTGLDKVKVIGYGAFSETKLKHFNFSEVPNVEAIQSSAFKETQLKQVDFAPLKNLREIGSYAFLNASVENINWGEDSKLESIGWEAFSKNNIKELDLSSLKYLSNISGHAFEKNKLENLILPSTETFTSLKLERGNRIFANNNLKTVYLPDNIKEVHNETFLYNGNPTRPVALMTPGHRNPNGIKDFVRSYGGHIVDPNLVTVRYVYEDENGNLIDLREPFTDIIAKDTNTMIYKPAIIGLYSPRETEQTVNFSDDQWEYEVTFYYDKADTSPSTLKVELDHVNDGAWQSLVGNHLITSVNVDASVSAIQYMMLQFMSILIPPF